MPNNRTPTIRLKDVKSDSITFELSDTDISMANSLRRVMIAEVPTLSIDLVEFHANSTCMQDEYIAHRLGLIPIRSSKDMKRWSYNHDCDCDDYCRKCSVKFTLDCDFNKMSMEYLQDNPASPDLISILVTSKHLKSDDVTVEPVHFSNELEARTSKDEGIAIMRIGPGQCLKLEAIAKKGIGKEHSKWSPVCTVALKFDPIVTLNHEM